MVVCYTIIDNQNNLDSKTSENPQPCSRISHQARVSVLSTPEGTNTGQSHPGPDSFFFFFFLSIASFPLFFQIKLSPRGLFLPGCVPQFLHSLQQTWDVICLRRSPHIQEAYLFTGAFWDWPLLALFTPCLFLLPLTQPLPHFRGFWGPLCRFFGVYRL